MVHLRKVHLLSARIFMMSFIKKFHKEQFFTYLMPRLMDKINFLPIIGHLSPFLLTPFQD